MIKTLTKNIIILEGFIILLLLKKIVETKEK